MLSANFRNFMSDFLTHFDLVKIGMLKGRNQTVTTGKAAQLYLCRKYKNQKDMYQSNEYMKNIYFNTSIA